MTRPEAKGWCPGAWRPMMSGDGLVVRVRPQMARLERAQVIGLCEAAQTHGSGLIDLTSRANLQVRGVREETHEPLLERLTGLGLLPDDPALESRRNILIPPFWQEDDATHALGRELSRRLGELPDLPAKFGFAVDTGPAPVFHDNSADIRLERTPSGEILLIADGMTRGRVVTQDKAVDALIEMAHWFARHRGDTRRMAQLLLKTGLPADWQGTLRAAPADALTPGQHTMGAVYGAAFGQLNAARLLFLIDATGAEAMRVTPWRLFVLEGGEMFDSSDFVTRADDPLRMIDACPGAPFCEAATVETRSVARALAHVINGPLHVSGCAKGCARPRNCRTTLIGRNGAFDLVRDGVPWDEPRLKGLAPDTLTDRIGEE